MFTGPYIVRRDFKAGGEFYPAGQIIEDVTTVKLFKVRINEGLIVPLPSDEVSLEALRYYFENRLGLDLAKILQARATEGSIVAAPVKPSASANPKPPGTTQPQPQKTSSASTIPGVKLHTMPNTAAKSLPSSDKR